MDGKSDPDVIHCPEHRLLLLLFLDILAMVALILCGFTADGTATLGGPFMGWTLFQVAFLSVSILSTSLAAEAWGKNPGPALVAGRGNEEHHLVRHQLRIDPHGPEVQLRCRNGILAGVTGDISCLGFRSTCPALP